MMILSQLRDPKRWVRPMLLLSVGLHGALLWLPMPASPSLTEAEPEIAPEDTIKITQLPGLGEFPPAPPESGITPMPLGTKPAGDPVRPSRSSRSQPLNRADELVVDERALDKRPRPQASPTPATPTPPSESTPKTEPTPNNTNPEPGAPTHERGGGKSAGEDGPATTTPGGGGGGQAVDPFVNFPVYGKALAGSVNLLPPQYDRAAMNTRDSLATVGEFYQAVVPKREFNPLEVVSDDPAFRVYKVSTANVAPRYLHLISIDQQTIILLLSQALQPTEIAKLKEVETLTAEERQFEQLFAQLYTEKSMSDFALTDPIANPPKELEKNPDKLLARGKVSQPFPNSELEQQVKTRLEQLNGQLVPLGAQTYLVQLPNNMVRTIHFVSLDGGQSTGVVTTAP
jgi:hypothetical protein